MKAFFRILSLLTALLLTLPTAAMLAACNKNEPGSSADETVEETESEPTSETDTEAETAPQLSETVYALKDSLNLVRVMGRYSVMNTGITSDWMASGIEFTATYEGDIELLARTTDAVEYRVFINGEDMGTVTFSGFPVYRKLPGSGEHAGEQVTIRLARVTNVESGNVGILSVLESLRLTGILHETIEERPYVEFLGDSITCGSDLYVGDNYFDGTATYAYKTAAALGVDYSMVAVSGIGVSAGNERHEGRTISSFLNNTSWYRDQTDSYTPPRRADLVVVNLNTNDANAGATEAEYKEDLRALIAAIRALHGNDVKIVWVVGQMISSTNAVNGWMNDVFTELGGEDAGLYTVVTYKNNDLAHGHPSQQSHNDAAKALEAFIRLKGFLN